MRRIYTLQFMFFMFCFSWYGGGCEIYKTSVEALANDLLVVQLYTATNFNNGGPVHDSFGIHFAVGNDNGLTLKDAVKPMNFNENLGINHNGTLLSYESREMPQVGEIFAMYSSGYQSTQYVLKMFTDGLTDTYFVLEDQYTGTSTAIGPGNTAYFFNIDNSQPLSKATDRFSIRVDAVATDYIYVNGTWAPGDPNGVSSYADNIQVLNGTTALTTDSHVNNLTVNAGATLKVHNVLSLHGDLTNNGNLIFVSDSLGNGELAAVPATSTITGHVTVERYMGAKRSYRMVSSAVTTSNSIHNNWQEGAISAMDDPAPGFGTHITGTLTDQQNGFDATATGNPSMFTVDVTNQMFEAIDNTNLNTLVAGDPYLLFVRGDRSINLENNTASGETVLRATGALHVGPYSKVFDSIGAGNFVMFGNPYQSAINIKEVLANSSNLNTSQYYIYDPYLADHGAYVTIDLSTGTNASSSEANEYLQPGQGAQVATLVNGTSSVVFNETDKAPGKFTSSNKNPVPQTDMLMGQLYTKDNFLKNGPVHDGFAIRFAEGNSNALTSSDAVKPMNFHENLGIYHNGTYLSIEYREMPSPSEEFQLYISGYRHSEYVIKSIIEGMDNTPFYLEDHFAEETVPLNIGETVYAFSVDTNDPSSIATDRFSIRTGERLSTQDTILFSDIQLFPNPLDGNTLYVKAPSLDGQELDIDIIDLTGRKVFGARLECRNNIITLALGQNLLTGTYLITFNNGAENHTMRLLKE